MRYGNVINRKDILMGKHVQTSPRRLNKKINRSLTAVAAVGFILSATTGSAIAAPIANDTPKIERASVVTGLDKKAEVAPKSLLAPAVTAPATAKLSFTRSEVVTVAAPKKEEPKPEPVKVQLAEAEVAAPVAAPAPAQPMNLTNPAVITPIAPATPAAPVASNGTKGAAILAAARAQIGVNQDCTMLVTNALKAVGINFHDWPAGYKSLGTIVSAVDAQPGDLIYYADGGGGQAHIAVYAGGGRAVHGGFNGNSTIEFSANVGSGPVFIRVN